MKRIMAFSLLISLLAGLAFASGFQLMISSDQDLKQQFSDFREYLDHLPKQDKNAWIEELKLIAKENPAIEKAGIAENNGSDSSEQMVWIPKNGSKYHKNSTCSNMADPQQVPLSTAIEMGYERCKRCKP